MVQSNLIGKNIWRFEFFRMFGMSHQIQQDLYLHINNKQGRGYPILRLLFCSLGSGVTAWTPVFLKFRFMSHQTFFPTRETHLKWAVQLQVEAKLHSDSLNVDSDNIKILHNLLLWFGTPETRIVEVFDLIETVCNETSLELTAGADYLETVEECVIDIVDQVKELSNPLNARNDG